MTELSPAMLAVLTEEREALNARVALRKRAGQTIDGAALLEHLRVRVGPIIERVHHAWPERARGALLGLADASLDLLAASLLGPESKLPIIATVWEQLLPELTTLVAREPLRVAGCMSNAIVQIAHQRGTRPLAWLESMQRVASHCESIEQLLTAGRIAAWQAGMVQYRPAALAAAPELATPLAALALGIDGGTPSEALKAAFSRMAGDPWLTCEAALGAPAASPTLRLVAQAGAFRGFGGVFMRPPVVMARDGQLIVSDGLMQWKMLADAYGVWFQRVDSGPLAKVNIKGEASIDKQGRLCWGAEKLAQPQLVKATSLAVAGGTLAVTIPTSHHVFLYSKGAA